MRDMALILGIAPCLEDDLSSILWGRRGDEFDYIAVGLDCSCRFLGDIQHVVSYHSREFKEFKSRREQAGGNSDYTTHSHIPPADRIWPLIAKSPFSGSSSFLAAQVAVGLGYKKAILCGCPLVGPNNNPKKKERYETFQIGWTTHAPDALKGLVRSMGGFTMGLLGYPDEEWLSER